MKINQEQKDLLIGVLQNAIDNLNMDESMEFGGDLQTLLIQAKEIQVTL